MIKPGVHSCEILRFQSNSAETTHDLLAVEEPLEIRIGYGPTDMREQKSISVTMRTPGHDFELALGFLFTENIIHSPTQVYKIQYCTEANTIENKENIVRVELQPDVVIDLSKLQRHFYTTSSCGVCGKESIEAIRQCRPEPLQPNDFNITANVITTLPDTLRASQNVFEHTGGLHACALFNNKGELQMLREDVGRHNALDKLVGAVLATHPEQFSQGILLLSGRASFELLQKAAMAQIAVVCAVGAPSSLAVKTAEEFGITLIGFLRGERFNVYTHAERVLH